MITYGDDTPMPAVDAGHQHRFVTMEGMAVPTARLKTYIEGHLDFHASHRWPQVCRLRYLGSDTDWGFALYQASSERYDDTLLPDGSPSGTPEQALDCALGLYLTDDPTAWIKPPKD